MLRPLEVANVFSPEECSEIIAAAHPQAFAEAGLVAGRKADGIRRARIAWLDETKDGAWIFRRLLETVNAANREYFHFDLEEFGERMQVAWYIAEAQGFFDWHSDIGQGPLASRRKLTIVIQLSDPGSYQGGDLEINADGNVYRATWACGSAVLMPSFVLHRVTPVTRNSRFSLTLWAHGPHFH